MREQYIVPSYNAALLLVLSSILLNWSSISLLVGIGIYYGIVHTQNLSSVRGENSSLAILLVYVLFTLGAFTSYILPWLQKQLESTAPAQSVLEQLSRVEPRNSPNSIARPDPSGPAQANLGGHGPSDHLLRTGRIDSSGDPATRQEGNLESQDSTQAIRMPQTRIPPFPQPHPEPRLSSNELRVHFQANSSLTKSSTCATAATEAFVAALDASISAQKASLQAHDLLRSELQKQKDLRTFTRRASL